LIIASAYHRRSKQTHEFWFFLYTGSAIGLLSGFFANRLLGRIVYQANPRDPLVVCGAVLAMALLGIIASAIPARRALAADPSRLFREE
jgi:ABC-type antimicrobial peptide transport system permease subunit